MTKNQASIFFASTLLIEAADQDKISRGSIEITLDSIIFASVWCSMWKQESSQN